MKRPIERQLLCLWSRHESQALKAISGVLQLYTDHMLLLVKRGSQSREQYMFVKCFSVATCNGLWLVLNELGNFNFWRTTPYFPSIHRGYLISSGLTQSPREFYLGRKGSQRSSDQTSKTEKKEGHFFTLGTGHCIAIFSSLEALTEGISVTKSIQRSSEWSVKRPCGPNRTGSSARIKVSLR